MNEQSRTSGLPQTGTAQRIRVGVTGLGAIFLIVMVAAAGMRPATPAAALDAKAETLAVLGVAPSSGAAATLQSAAPVPPPVAPAALAKARAPRS